MTIAKVDSVTPANTSSPSIHFLKVGMLRIEGREYAVSVESSDPLVKRPHGDTLDRIRDLVDLHLNHLKKEGVDLSTIVIQQLDEEGLSYMKREAEKEGMVQGLLSSSEVNFETYNPFANNYSSYPKSLQDASILNISDIYRSIIDSLTKKSESEDEEESTIPTDNKNPFKEHTNLESGMEKTQSEQLIDSSDESSDLEEEISESEDENVGLISGRSKDFSQYNQSGIVSNIKDRASSLFSKIWNSLPTLRNETNAIDAQEIIAQKESIFRSEISSAEQATLMKFATIKFD